MSYTDLNPHRQTTKDSSRPRWARSALLVLGTVVVIYGLKLLLTPIGGVLGTVLGKSTSTIAWVLNAPKNLKQSENVTNFLLVGIDRRSKLPYEYLGEGGKIEKNGFLADTIIIASFNHQTREVSLLSLPRDLWVQIPAFGKLSSQSTKINAAHSLGDEYGFPGGGMALLGNVVGSVLGVPIHYYLRVDFEAFEKAIDAIGGIDILVEHAFDDFMYPKEGFENAAWDERYEHLHFEAGLKHMDGATALKFARSRNALGSEGSDFARSKRQQKVIVAVKNKILENKTLLDLTRLKDLYFALSSQIAINVELNELPLFFDLISDLENTPLKTYVLDGNEGGTGLLYHPSDLENYGGAWVLLPKGSDFSQIQKFVRQIFYKE